MRYQETETIELKSSLTTSFEKELVAFLNTHNGTIYIGVNDNGDICGVDNLDETMCKISDIITDGILPNPQELVTISTKLVNALWIIEVNVTRGNLLYYIGRYGRSSKGCYIRVGTTCKSMTEKQIETRYKEIYSPKCDITKIESTQNDLTFKQLKIYYTEKNYHLSNRTFKKNLHLLTTTGKYNLLAEMLADGNRVSIKIARFKGRDKSELSEKSEYGYKCLLIAIDKIINRLEAENYAMSVIKSGQRIDKRLFDMSSLREIFINAIAYNDWTIVEPAIYIFDNRIEIISHGGLPDGQTVEMFYKGISTPRNKELMRILADLNYVEQTGHGIPNVIKVYGKKIFDINEKYINVIIPFDKEVLLNHQNNFYKQTLDLNCPSLNENVGVNVGVKLNKTQYDIYMLLTTDPHMTYNKLSNILSKSEETIRRNIKVLVNYNLVERCGSDKTGYWNIIDKSFYH